MDNPIYFELTLKNSSEIGFEFESEEQKIDFGFDTPVIVSTSNIPIYEGEYEITPSADGVTLLTQDLRMTANVVINPIPSSWGRIGWNGAYLTVS